MNLKKIEEVDRSSKSGSPGPGPAKTIPLALIRDWLGSTMVGTKKLSMVVSGSPKRW